MGGGRPASCGSTSLRSGGWRGPGGDERAPAGGEGRCTVAARRRDAAAAAAAAPALGRGARAARVARRGRPAPPPQPPRPPPPLPSTLPPPQRPPTTPPPPPSPIPSPPPPPSGWRGAAAPAHRGGSMTRRPPRRPQTPPTKGWCQHHCTTAGCQHPSAPSSSPHDSLRCTPTLPARREAPRTTEGQWWQSAADAAPLPPPSPPPIPTPPHPTPTPRRERRGRRLCSGTASGWSQRRLRSPARRAGDGRGGRCTSAATARLGHGATDGEKTTKPK